MRKLSKKKLIINLLSWKNFKKYFNKIWSKILRNNLILKKLSLKKINFIDKNFLNFKIKTRFVRKAWKSIRKSQKILINKQNKITKNIKILRLKLKKSSIYLKIINKIWKFWKKLHLIIEFLINTFKKISKSWK